MLSDLLIKLKSQLLLTEQSGVVIFGSLAIVLQGVALGRPIDDLDIFASEEAFEKLAKRFQIQFKDGTGGLSETAARREDRDTKVLPRCDF
jgi:hypothetical protein